MKNAIVVVDKNNDATIDTLRMYELLEKKEFKKKNSLFKIQMRKFKKKGFHTFAACVGNEIRIF